MKEDCSEISFSPEELNIYFVTAVDKLFESRSPNATEIVINYFASLPTKKCDNNPFSFTMIEPEDVLRHFNDISSNALSTPSAPGFTPIGET